MSHSLTRISVGLAELTIVVNNQINISLYQGSEPPDEGCSEDARKIEGGPLYSREQLEPLLVAAAARAWTKDAKADATRLKLDDIGLTKLVRDAIEFGRFKGSVWCLNRPGGPWAAADAYKLKRREWNDAAYKELECEYYVKFAIGKAGALILMVSVHL